MADAPSVITGSQKDFRKLYYSDPDAALKIMVTIAAGYGELKQGQALALNGSASGNVGKFIPYDPYNSSYKSATVDGTQIANNRA